MRLKRAFLQTLQVAVRKRGNSLNRLLNTVKVGIQVFLSRFAKQAERSLRIAVSHASDGQCSEECRHNNSDYNRACGQDGNLGSDGFHGVSSFFLGIYLRVYSSR